MPAEDAKIRSGEGAQMNNRPFEENVLVLVLPKSGGRRVQHAHPFCSAGPAYGCGG